MAVALRLRSLAILVLDLPWPERSVLLMSQIAH